MYRYIGSDGMPTHARQPKHRLLCEELRKRLLKMEPGAGFLSVREIMHSFEVSQATVTKALESLCGEGLLETNVGSGTFVTEEVLRHRKGAAPSICLAIPRWESTFFLIIASAFTSACERMGLPYEIIMHDWRELMPSKLPARKIDGMVLVPSSPLFRAEDVVRIKALGKPVAVFGCDMKGMDVDSVYADDVYCGKLAASHLIKLGHRKLCAIVSEPRNRVIMDRIDGFAEQADLVGLKAEIVDCGIVSGDFAPSKVYAKIKGLLASGGLDFSGAFITSAPSALGALKAFNEAGVGIPRQLSVIGCTGDSLSQFYSPSLTVINEPFQQMVDSCLDLLLKRIEGGPATPYQSRRLRPLLIERESTGPLNGARLETEGEL